MRPDKAKALIAAGAAFLATQGGEQTPMPPGAPIVPVIAGSGANGVEQAKNTARQSFEFRVDTTDQSLLVNQKPDAIGARVAYTAQSSFDGTMTLAKGSGFLGQAPIGKAAEPPAPAAQLTPTQ